MPVRFAIDRAGLVGADGATHAGSFDLAYLLCLPNVVVMAPSDENELKLSEENYRYFLLAEVLLVGVLFYGAHLGAVLSGRA